MNKTLARQEYVPTTAVIEELHDWIKHDGQADYITLAGSGEPTLHSSFGEVIESIKSATTIPVALLTNGSLLCDEDVRQAAARADVVKVSLSAWDSFSFKQINRPHAEVTLKSIVEGAWMLRNVFSGQLWIEVFIVCGVNCVAQDVIKIAELVGPLQPDRIQLNTAVRPPSEEFVVAATDEQLAKLVDLFDPVAEVIAESSSNRSSFVQANEKHILAMLARRPCTTQQVAHAFGMHRNEIAKYVGKLRRSGQIRLDRTSGDAYCVVQEKELDLWS